LNQNKWMDELPAETIHFGNQKRMNHFFDRHPKDGLNIQGTRNKERLAQTEAKLKEFASEPDTKSVDSSFRYESPTYHYFKEASEVGQRNNLILTIDSVTNEPISIRNGTNYQFDSIDRDGNLGLDGQPANPDGDVQLSLLLRSRGGPNF